MDKNQSIQEVFQKYVLPTYARQPMAVVKGKGAWVWDANGKKYLDCVAGVAVNNLGHAPARIASALARQAKVLIHCSNLYYNPWQGKLAQKLVELSGLDKAFFCNSGAEAIEACLKLARYFFYTKWQDRHDFIVMEGSFHGRTFGALSATAQKKYQEGFAPLVPGFTSVPYNNVEAVTRAITDKTCAILVEPLQGEGGVNIPDAGYLPALRQLASEKGLLLILDEVQAGLGRTGRFLASQHQNVKPDLIALAKGLGAGVPIGAALVSESIAAIVKPGIHASTFGGNPLVCAAALESVSTLSKKDFLKNVEKKGAYLVKKLQKLASKYPLISSVRGQGLMVAFELGEEKGGAVVEKALQKGLLLNALQNKIIRLVPPLVITLKEIDRAVSILDEIFSEGL